MTTGGGGPRHRLPWCEEHEEAFQRALLEYELARLLKHLDPDE